MAGIEEITKVVQSLGDKEYYKFMRDVHLGYKSRTPALTNKIVNSWKNVQKREVKTVISDSGLGGKHVSSSDSNVRPGTSSQGCKLELSVPLPWQKSAWKTGLIFRGDKVPLNGKLFLDVEKVTLKRTGKSHFQKAATVCLVNEDGKVVLWAFIHIPHDKICQYAPKITNLDERKLGIGVELEMVHKCLDICLKNNKLIGVAVKNDLTSLEYNFSNYFDLQSVYCDENNQAFSLGHIAKQLINNRSGFQAGHHSAIDDARMTLAAYKFYLKATELKTFTSDLEKLSSSRKAYKASRPALYSEQCKCNID